MGASAIFDVFDQQFIIFFKTFFDSASQGTIIYSYMTSGQTVIEFILMFPMPWIINKIGSKNGLIIYGFLTCVRILGSALAPSMGMGCFLPINCGTRNATTPNFYYEVHCRSI